MKTKRNYKKILKWAITLIACILILGILAFFGIQILVIIFTPFVYQLRDCPLKPPDIIDKRDNVFYLRVG
jgi:hypothetical protein